MSKPDEFRSQPVISRETIVAIGVIVALGISVYMFSDHLVSWSDPKRTLDAEIVYFDPSVSEDERKMYMLGGFGSTPTDEILEGIVREDDKRFLPVIVDVFRLVDSGAVIRGGMTEFVFAFDKLSGEKLRGAPGTRYPTSSHWILWLGEQDDIVPPPGYVTWKGRLLGSVDPNYEDFFYDGVNTAIRVEEIIYSGKKLDAIRALEQPTMISAADAEELEAAEPVFGIEVNGEARAYPTRFLDYHEIVNDVIGEVPITLAYCALCGAGIAYDSRGEDGTAYTFGTSGLLYRSNKLMFDRQSRMLWNQMTGYPVVGEAAGTDFKLNKLPLVATTWDDWKSSHPQTQVMFLEKRTPGDYRIGTRYGNYFQSSGTRYPVWQKNDRLPLKTQIYCLEINGLFKAYPLKDLTDHKVRNDRFGETPLVLVATRGTVEVNRRVTVSLRNVAMNVDYSTGGEVRAFQAEGQTFSPGADEQTILDDSGQPWQVTESALVGPSGEKLPRVPGHLAYWFGWYTMHPDTLVFDDGQ